MPQKLPHDYSVTYVKKFSLDPLLVPPSEKSIAVVSK